MSHLPDAVASLTPHRRKLIRHAVKAMYVASEIMPETKIFASRVMPIQEDQLPAMTIYCEDEEVDLRSHTTAPLELERLPVLSVCAHLAVTADGNIDDDLDDYCRAMERVISLDDQLRGTVESCKLIRTDTAISGSGNTLVGTARLSYLVKYYEGAPRAEDVELDDFDRADIRYNTGGDQEAGDQAHDRVGLADKNQPLADGESEPE